jgi:hypothetical protein
VVVWGCRTVGVWWCGGCGGVWGVGCGGGGGGGWFPFAFEHSKVCTLCDFGHLQFFKLFFSVKACVEANFDDHPVCESMLSHLLNPNNGFQDQIGIIKDMCQSRLGEICPNGCSCVDEP